MQHITSRENPRLKSAMRLLASSRERRKLERCVLEGEHLVEVYCRRHGAPETLLIVESALSNATVQALMQVVPPRDTLVVGESAWVSLAALPSAIGALAVIQAPHPTLDRVADFCLLLEDLQDPGNVGSIIRTAAASGVEQVFLSPGCAFAWSPKVLRAAQGGHFHLDIFEDVDLGEWARNFRGKLVATVANRGASLFAADLASRPLAIAIGNEGGGLSAGLCQAASTSVTIPMPGGFESLNAAAAAAICLFESVRQREALRRSRSTA
jgi:RNA methyltransferase, TrmH family